MAHRINALGVFVAKDRSGPTRLTVWGMDRPSVMRFGADNEITDLSLKDVRALHEYLGTWLEERS